MAIVKLQPALYRKRFSKQGSNNTIHNLQHQQAKQQLLTYLFMATASSNIQQLYSQDN